MIAYLNEQINKIKPQALASSQAAVDYGYENGLGILDGLPLAGRVSGAGVSKDGGGQGISIIGSGRNVEASRTSAQQRVMSLEVQLKAARQAGTSSIYFASRLSSLTDKSSTFDKLTSVETRLAELRSRFKDNDPLIQKLKRERNALVRYINEQTIALLEGELDLALANLKSLSRPREVVARHRELTQKALRDEATLVTLQNQLKQFELEQARATSPWELISTPTLLDKPVSPRKRRTLALGLLAGLVMGSGGALARDRRSGRVYSIVGLDRFLPGLCWRLPCQGDSPAIGVWKSPIQLLADGPLRSSSRSFPSVKSMQRTSRASPLNYVVPLAPATSLWSAVVYSPRAAHPQVLITAPGCQARRAASTP